MHQALYDYLLLFSCVQLFATLQTTACQTSLSFTISWSLLKLTSMESVSVLQNCKMLTQLWHAMPCFLFIPVPP